jgi:aspartyl-tRNA(Asn)/glutamyl-tRNA(Gln) amidotransferase subunit A
MTPEEALDAGVAQVAPEIQSGRLSPVALAEASLERLNTTGRELNAVATITRDLAMAQARQAQEEIAAGRYRGPLHGIPYGAKDLLATRGIPTSWGARPLVNQVIDQDAVVIQRLREAGAVLVAKLAMIELAGGLGYKTANASATGPAKNPRAKDRWTCGSSSGSGAAMGARLVGFTIGSETWGSILCPSSFCGVSGLRPTYGLVPRTGAMALSWSMDKIGPMCGSAEDCELVLAAIAGPDAGDPASLPSGLPAPAVPANLFDLRIGVVRPAEGKGVDPEVLKAFDAAVELLRGTGFKPQTATLPDLPFEPVAVVFIVCEAAAAFEPLISSGQVRQLVDSGAPLAEEAAKTVTGADYVRAMQVRRIIQSELAKMFESFDLLISPTLPFTATPIASNLEEAFSVSDPLGAAGNVAGLPSLSVPCGLSKDGLPIGMQIVGPPLGEKRVLAVGKFYQEHEREPS